MHNENLECGICGDLSTTALEYANAGGFAICGKCVDIIVNVYWKKHSGKYLTWANDPSPVGYNKEPIPESLRWQVFERDGYACKHCGCKSMLRADHIIPEVCGGAATLENLQTLCVRCNSRKGVRST